MAVGAVEPLALRVDNRLAWSNWSRSSGTRPVSTSRAGLRRVLAGPAARMLSFSSSTCMPRSGAARRAEVALGGTRERPWLGVAARETAP
jgi:hypothetical protein